MNTEPKPQPTAGEINFPTAPKRSWLNPVIAIIVVIAAAASGYFGYIWYQNKYAAPTTANEVSNVAAEANTTDPVTAELKSLSNSTDTSTIKAEIADTKTSDISTEIDNINAELTGF